MGLSGSHEMCETLLVVYLKSMHYTDLVNLLDNILNSDIAYFYFLFKVYIFEN